MGIAVVVLSVALAIALIVAWAFADLHGRSSRAYESTLLERNNLLGRVADLSEHRRDLIRSVQSHQEWEESYRRKAESLEAVVARWRKLAIAAHERAKRVQADAELRRQVP